MDQTVDDVLADVQKDLISQKRLEKRLSTKGLDSRLAELKAKVNALTPAGVNALTAGDDEPFDEYPGEDPDTPPDTGAPDPNRESPIPTDVP